MKFQARVPAPPLDALIELLWLSDGYAPAHAQERLLPMGTMELIIDLHDDETLIVGAYSEFFTLDTSRMSCVMGAHFKPGGAFPVLGMPASELRNQHVALEDVWGRSAAQELRQTLLAAPTTEARFDVLEQALASRVAREQHPVVGFAVGEIARRFPTVESMVDRAGFSHRRFIDTFANEVGLTPKLYCRVQRFQRVLHRIARLEQIDWADVALACGYFDQPHFIHEFRAFAGMSPGMYLQRRTPHLNHVPL